MTVELLLAGVVLALANIRLTRLIIRDVIFEPFREWVWAKRPPHESMVGYLLTCPWCISIYTATFLVVSYILIPTVTLVFAAILALSAIAGFVDQRLDG
jgi:Mg/Co/Ni transporter MgtE